MKLKDIADYVSDRISSDCIELENYITTDCLLSDKQGRTIATNLPPKKCSLIRFQKDDILVSNIRPYLKKIWYANCNGGASTDVLVFRAKNKHLSTYLYSVLLQDSFYDWTMKGPKGSRMPRGDKSQILQFPIVNISESAYLVGESIKALNVKIALNKQINQNLEALARQLYDYWFVQFDFPNEEGKPYKSSGGKMIYNPILKREIPEGWEVKTLSTYISKNNTGDWGKDEYFKNCIEVGCIRGADIVNLCNLPTRYIKNNPSKLLQQLDIVIEISGGSPIQATGRSALITEGVIDRNGGAISCSNFCNAFTMKNH